MEREHRFHTPGEMELDVRIPSGDVEVVTVDGEETRIELEGDERLLEQTVVEQRGNRIVVELRGKKPFGITIEIGGWSFGTEKLRVRARIPHAGAVSIATASADMNLDGHYSWIETKSASGDLDVHGDVERTAVVKTVSGDARLTRVGGDVTVQSVSGDVRVDEAGGTVTAKSVSGDVRVGKIHGNEAQVASVSGDIEIGVVPGRAIDVDANSVSGDLSSEVPLGSDPVEGGPDLPMLVVRGKTVSGDFRLVRTS